VAKKSEAVRLKEIEKDTEIVRQVGKVLCDPLWSSVLGFVVVHEARKANLVGPVADDILYAGIIAINTNRAGLVAETYKGVGGIFGGLREAGSSALSLLPVVGG